MTGQTGFFDTSKCEDCPLSSQVRTYSNLTDEEKQKAREIALTELLKVIIGGGLRFSDELNHDDLQARIDKAMLEAERMQTPWFAHEYILDVARDELEGLAEAYAEDALYPEPDADVIRLEGGIR